LVGSITGVSLNDAVGVSSGVPVARTGVISVVDVAVGVGVGVDVGVGVSSALARLGPVRLNDAPAVCWPATATIW
jgi:hypothetical protein